MKRVFSIVTLVVLALAASGVMLAQGGNAEQEIRAVMDQIRNATLKGDAEAFGKCTADDYTSIGADGKVLSKAEVLDGLRTAKFKYESIDTSGIQVRLYGDTAVVTDTSSIKAHRGDLDMSGQYRTARVFVKRGGKWQQVLAQRTKIAS
jgi:uncharacterized protein (TIGR02246 family)